MTPWSFDPTRQEVPPWKPTMTEDFIFIDFRRRSCNKSCLACGQDYPQEDDPSITQYDESNKFQPFDGIHLIIHSPDEYPLNHGQSVHLVSWAGNWLTFYPEMFLIDDEIKTWSLKKRNCYLEGEKKLTFFKIYTKNNCEHECLSFLMSKSCGCVPFYLIRKTKLLFFEIIKINISLLFRIPIECFVRYWQQKLRQRDGTKFSR